MTPTEVIEIIKDSKRRKEDWFKMASLIDEVSRSTTWVGHYKSNADWLKSAAEASGYQATVVRRMLRVRNFLERMQHAGFALPQKSYLPLASLEILERMYAVEPTRCKELLGKAVKGEITLREVQNEYSIVTSNPAGANPLLKVEPFFSETRHAVIKSIELFSGINNMTFGYKPNLHTSLIPDIYAFHNFEVNDIFIVAFKLILIKDTPYKKNQITKVCLGIIRELAFTSQFFDRVWLIFSDGAGIEYAKQLPEMLNELGLINIGVTVFKGQSSSQKDSWQFFGSVLNPAIETPEDPNFFPSSNQYAPKWKHLVKKYIYNSGNEVVEDWECPTTVDGSSTN